MPIQIQSTPDSSYEMCVFPRESRRKRASWIIYMNPDGSGVLYLDREESGAVIGEQIQLPANAVRGISLLEIPNADRDEDEAVDTQGSSAVADEASIAE